jgi:acetyl-CoA carboxylase alpha subunit
MFQRVKSAIKNYLSELDAIDAGQRIDQRIEKFNKMGVWV